MFSTDKGNLSDFVFPFTTHYKFHPIVLHVFQRCCNAPQSLNKDGGINGIPW